MTEKQERKKLVITFDSENIPPSMNGSGGLINMHFAQRKRKKDSIMWYILDKNPEKISFKGPVRVTTIKHSSRLSDWDNAAGCFKLVGDALTKLQIITDDNPNVIVEFITLQLKSSRKDAKYVVEIEELL